MCMGSQSQATAPQLQPRRGTLALPPLQAPVGAAMLGAGWVLPHQRRKRCGQGLGPAGLWPRGFPHRGSAEPQNTELSNFNVCGPETIARALVLLPAAMEAEHPKLQQGNGATAAQQGGEPSDKQQPDDEPGPSSRGATDPVAAPGRISWPSKRPELFSKLSTQARPSATAS